MIHVLAKFGHDWPSSYVNGWWWTPTHSTRSPELLMWPKKVYNSFIYLTPSTLYIKRRIDTDFTSPICFYGLKLKFTTKLSFLFLHKAMVCNFKIKILVFLILLFLYHFNVSLFQHSLQQYDNIVIFGVQNMVSRFQVMKIDYLIESIMHHIHLLRMTGSVALWYTDFLKLVLFNETFWK